MGLKALAKKVKQSNRATDKSFEEQFLEKVDKFFVASPEELGKEPRPTRLAFRPSSFYKCQRQLFYFLNGSKEKKKEYPRSKRILEVGTALHEWIQTQVFMEMDKLGTFDIKLLPVEELPSYGQEGFEILREHNAPDMEVKFLDTRFTQKFPVSAMVDGAMSFMGKDFLFEFKTINTDDFEYLIQPLPDHVKQGAIYALCTGVRKVMFVYLDKNKQFLKAYLVEYTQEQLDWVVARMQSVENYVLEGELPPKEADDKCKWCGYKGLCDKEELA